MNAAVCMLLDRAKREPKKDMMVYSDYRRRIDRLGLDPLEHEEACKDIAEILLV